MRSSVNWALLGLVIERPSYAYELARRFEGFYRDVLSLSSKSHVYTALSALQARSLIEEVPGTRSGRQPRPCYRATSDGVESYREWLVGQVQEDRRRQLLLVLQLSALGATPTLVLEVLDHYEHAWRAQASKAIPRSVVCPDDEVRAAFVDRILSDESRLTVAAKLSWVQDVRRAVKQLVDEQRPGPDQSSSD